MKQSFLILFLMLLTASCGSSKSTVGANELRDELNNRNRTSMTLMDLLRQKPGIFMSRGVPVLMAAANSFNGEKSFEPLYVVNGFIVGNSFRDLRVLIDPNSVKSIKVVKVAEASKYGSRGGNGAIEITTY
ncbi:MAG: TonB-dependent receptor [Flavobacteriaceae bacterium]